MCLETEKSDYEAFQTHVEEWNKEGIPYGLNDLIELAKKYNCEIPTVVDGKLIYKTI